MKKFKIITLAILALLMIIIPLTVNASFAEDAAQGASHGVHDVLLDEKTDGKTDIIVKTETIYGEIDPDTYEPVTLQEDEVYGFEAFGGKIAGIIQIIGTMVSVGTIMIIGIRYVGASADEKAEYKERMIPYFIGAVLLFGASNIVNIIYNMF